MKYYILAFLLLVSSVAFSGEKKVDRGPAADEQPRNCSTISGREANTLRWFLRAMENAKVENQGITETLSIENKNGTIDCTSIEMPSKMGKGHFHYMCTLCFKG